MIATLAALALAAQPPALRAGLEPLGFLVGHCWRGTFRSGETDTHCFEPVYGGLHVRDRHEVVGPQGGPARYRGESLYSADAAAAVSYTYWNSLGGVSRGTLRRDGERLDFGFEQYQGPDGRRLTLATQWRRIGDDAYEAVTSSADAPSMNRTIRYERVADTVSVETRTEPDGSRTLVHEAIVDAPPAEVWRAVSTAEGWTSWAVPVAWMDDDLLETSYAPGAARGDSSTIQQRIVARVAGRLLVFRTVKAPRGFPNFDTFRRVTHLIEVEPAGEGRSRVRLTSAGYPDDAAGRQLLAFFTEGNRITLERLNRRFRQGPVDWSRGPEASASGRE